MKYLITFFILIIVIFNNIGCSSQYKLNEQLFGNSTEKLNLLILFTNQPRIKENQLIQESLYYTNLTDKYIDKFRLHVPSIIKDQVKINEIDIIYDNKFPYFKSEYCNIDLNKEINIFIPDAEDLKEISGNSNVALIFQEISIFISGQEGKLGSIGAPVGGNENIYNAIDGQNTSIQIPYLISGGIFTIYDINKKELLDYGMFATSTPAAQNERFEMWRDSISLILNECFFKSKIFK